MGWIDELYDSFDKQIKSYNFIFGLRCFFAVSFSIFHIIICLLLFIGNGSNHVYILCYNDTDFALLLNEQCDRLSSSLSIAATRCHLRNYVIRESKRNFQTTNSNEWPTKKKKSEMKIIQIK